MVAPHGVAMAYLASELLDGGEGSRAQKQKTSRCSLILSLYFILIDDLDNLINGNQERHRKSIRDINYKY